MFLVGVGAMHGAPGHHIIGTQFTHWPPVGPDSKLERLSSSSTICAMIRIAERPSVLVQSECAGRLWGGDREALEGVPPRSDFPVFPLAGS